MTSTSTPLRRHNGAAIRAIRIKSGLKPKDMVGRTGLSYQHLDNLENERKDASLEVLYRIASALEVPVQALVRDPASLEIKAGL